MYSQIYDIIHGLNHEKHPSVTGEHPSEAHLQEQPHTNIESYGASHLEPTQSIIT